MKGDKNQEYERSEMIKRKEKQKGEIQQLIRNK